MYAYFCRFPEFSRPPSAGDLAVAFSSLKALKSIMYVSSILLVCGENFVDQVQMFTSGSTLSVVGAVVVECVLSS